MAVDFHTHFTGGRFFFDGEFRAEQFLADMDANQITKSLLLPLDGFFKDHHQENDRIAELLAAHPERFAGLGTVNPRLLDDAVREMERCITRKGLLGMKFHPWLQAFSPLDGGFIELAAEAASYKTLFFFHDGTPPYTEPLQIAELARRYPDLTIVLGHSGLNDLWREALLAAQRYENVWLCFCGCPFWGMHKIAETLGGERIVWGSDYPLAGARDVHERLRQVDHLPLPDSIKVKILEENALELIGRFNKQPVRV